MGMLLEDALIVSGSNIHMGIHNCCLGKLNLCEGRTLVKCQKDLCNMDSLEISCESLMFNKDVKND